MDCLVIGNRWTGPWLAGSLARAGSRVACWVLESVPAEPNPQADLLAAFVGSGELAHRHAQSFGAEVTQQLWKHSTQNLKRLQHTLETEALGAACQARWLADEDATQESSPAAVVQAPEFCRRLQANCKKWGVQLQSVSSVPVLERTGTFTYRAIGHGSTSKGVTGKGTAPGAPTVEVSASAVFIAAEDFPRPLIAGLESIWLPITLNRFTFRAPHPAPGIRLYQGGLDFAVSDGGPTLTAGSYRNLFADKGYGIRPGWVDPVAEQSVGEFFHRRGLAVEARPITRQVRFASLSCDGLPLVGNLTAYPGLFLISGFAGREENFFFELAERLAQSFVTGVPDPELAPYSPKRLV